MSAATLMQNNSAPQSGHMASASPTEFDYTFTDKELQEILGFMEHQAGGQDTAVTAAPPPFLSAPAQSGLALQFQPHAAPVQSGSTLTAHPYDQSSGVGMKAEPSSGSTGYAHAYAGVNGVSMSRGQAGPRQNSYGPASSSQLAPDRRTSLQQIQGSTAPKLDRGQEPFTLCQTCKSFSHYCMRGKLCKGSLCCRAQAAHQPQHC